MKKKHFPKLLLLLVPLVCGTIGLLIAGQPFLNALFNTVTMFVLNYGDEPANVLVEIARWTAPIASATGLILLFASVRAWAERRWKYWKGQSTAVYGEALQQQMLLDQIGSRGIRGEAAFVKADSYILLWDEHANYQFVAQHEQELAGHPVYIKSESLPSQASAEENIHLFYPEETAARVFWKEHFLYRQFLQNAGQLDIVLLGFGTLGEELVKYALLSNIFSPKQRITYHVFGKEQGFSQVYAGISQMEDQVIFYPEDWYEHLDLIRRADLVIVLEQEQQARLVDRLLLAAGTREQKKRKQAGADTAANRNGGHVSDDEGGYLVFSADTYALEIMNHPAIRIFDWKRQAYRYDYITRDTLFAQAKAINDHYVQLCSGDRRISSEEAWAELNAFTRYSNISSADYGDVQARILEVLRKRDTQAVADTSDGTVETAPMDNTNLTSEEMELLAELEHMRWCRYHWLHNWSYGQPAGGKLKDPVNRIHADLLPYKELPEEEKAKDREVVDIRFGLMRQ